MTENSTCDSLLGFIICERITKLLTLNIIAVLLIQILIALLKKVSSVILLFDYIITLFVKL